MDVLESLDKCLLQMLRRDRQKGASDRRESLDRFDGAVEFHARSRDGECSSNGLNFVEIDLMV